MGLGREFCTRVLTGGGRVVIGDKSVQQGKETCLELQKEYGTASCLFQEIDVTKKEDWETLWKVAEQFFQNQIDVLVNNAGVSPRVGFDLCMKVNLDGVLHGCNMFQDKLGKHTGGPGGLVVNTASIAGLLHGFDYKSLSYQVSKHAVVAATRSFGNEKVVRKTGIKHVAICPWFAETGILDDNEKELVQKKSPWGFVPVEKVGEAFQQTVTDQRSGSLIVVMPSVPLTYYPDVSTLLSTSVYLLSKVAQVFGVNTVHPSLQGGVLFVLLLLVIYVSHLLLTFCGL